METIKYILVLLTFAVLTGCSLEEEPYGNLSTENFYKNEADAEAAVVYAYANLIDLELYSRGYYLMTELGTDIIYVKSTGSPNDFEIENLRPTPENSSIGSMWSYSYMGILRANAILENVPQIEMDKIYQDQLIGEAYFLRALNHFNLVRFFGRIIIRDQYVSSVEMANESLSSIEDAYSIIISDLEKAVSLMDNTKRIGRANKVAAEGLLSKVYLHLASSKSSGSPLYDFVSDADAMYAKAKEYSGNVINNSLYGFDNDLQHIWGTDPAIENGPEHIFDFSTDVNGENEGQYSKLGRMYVPYFGSSLLTFIMDNDLDSNNVVAAWGHLLTDSVFYTSYHPNDKRRNLLMVDTVIFTQDNVVLFDSALSITDRSNEAKPFTRKYVDFNYSGEKSGTNSPVIRYSDILLVYAEACGSTGDGYNAVNQIRRRAGLTDLTSGLSNEAFRDSIIQERAWELAFEGHRLFDLRRSHKMEEMAAKLGKTNTTGLYFYPIPQTEIDENEKIGPEDQIYNKY